MRRIDWRLELGVERLKLGERLGAWGRMGAKLAESPGVGGERLGQLFAVRGGHLCLAAGSLIVVNFVLK